jgi:hypothetical protein
MLPGVSALSAVAYPEKSNINAVYFLKENAFDVPMERGRPLLVPMHTLAASASAKDTWSHPESMLMSVCYFRRMLPYLF